MSRTVGIDLGTTNSVVACLINDRIETIPNAEGAKTTPSVVLFGPAEVVVGELAKRQRVTQPGLVVRSAKRLMGRRFSEIGDILEDYPYDVRESENDRAEIQLTDGRMIPPELVAAQVLKKMVETAEDYLGDDVSAAVITVPAHFNDAQRTATKRAAELIDLEVIRIINEPTAAALAYGMTSEKEGAGQRIAVFDFGGGTFDISILQLTGDIFEVLSTNGNTQLGGDNIDLLVFQEICDGILQSTGIDPTQDLQAVSRIQEAAEKAKIELSSLSSTHISLPFIVADSGGPKHFEREITRDEFNNMMQPLFDSLFDPCEMALRDAHLTVREIDEVILVGGSTRIPRVQEMVAHFFQKPPNRSINPDEAVAIGAAIQAGVIRGELQELLLLDVTPLSLGIELAGGVFKSLIDRNSSVPCEATRKFTTVVDNQTSVVVHVLQGERAKAAENRTLARFRLTGIPPMPKELPEIEVTFRIDANGILEVSAVDLTSGVSTGIQVEGYGDCAAMTEEEIHRLLEEVSSHAREDQEFMRNAHRRAQADRIQNRVTAIIDALRDSIPAEDMKLMKETMLRHDLAVSGNDWMMAETYEGTLEDVIAKYEAQLEIRDPLAQMPQIAPSARKETAQPEMDEIDLDDFENRVTPVEGGVPRPELTSSDFIEWESDTSSPEAAPPPSPEASNEEEEDVKNLPPPPPAD